MSSLAESRDCLLTFINIVDKVLGFLAWFLKLKVEELFTNNIPKTGQDDCCRRFECLLKALETDSISLNTMDK